MEIKVTRRIFTADAAVSELSRIFADLQANPETHDAWDWMRAGFCLDIIQHHLGIEPPDIPFNGPTHPDGDSTDLGGIDEG